MKNCLHALALLTGFILACPANAQKYSYSVIPDGLSSTTVRKPYAINDSGLILVQPYSGFSESQTALLVSGTKVTTTEQFTPVDQYFALSNKGLMVGRGIGGVYTIDDVQYNQTFITIPAGDTAYPCGVNGSGLVVGMANSPTGPSYGWTWQSGTFTKFVYPKSTGCSLNAVNDSGEMAGTYFSGNVHDRYYAFITVKGKGTEIVVPGCIDPLPSAISTSGEVVGTALPTAKNTGQMVGFVRSKNGATTTIDYKSNAPKTVQGPSGAAPLSSQYQTELFGVNTAGQIVGLFTGTYVSSDGSWGETIYIPFLGTPK